MNVETQSPPDQQEQEELIEIEDTTEEDTFEEVEEEEVVTESQPTSQSPASSPTESYRLELTIDLTDSPPVSQQVSPPASQSSSLAQPSNPQSPALQCPVCLETFSAIRSRGKHSHWSVETVLLLVDIMVLLRQLS